MAPAMPGRMGRNGRNPAEISQPLLDQRLSRLAARRQGNVTRADLAELGFSSAAISRRVKNGRLYREHWGVDAVGRPATTPLERASAAVLACGKGAALSHASAMVLWGYWRRWEEPFEVTVPGDRRVPGVQVHRSSTVAWRELTTQLGIHVTTPARTIFDTAPRLDDRALKRTVSNALHSPWMGESQLEELVQRLWHLPAARRLAPLIGLPGTPSRSGWEDDFPAFCAQQRLPAPVMGASVCGYTVDALFAAHRLIVELDSHEFHLDPIAFEVDRERDAETLAHGFATVRMTWARIHGAPDREGARLRAILAQRAPRAA